MVIGNSNVGYVELCYVEIRMSEIVDYRSDMVENKFLGIRGISLYHLRKVDVIEWTNY